jgi:hypothetical protein
MKMVFGHFAATFEVPESVDWLKREDCSSSSRSAKDIPMKDTPKPRATAAIDKARASIITAGKGRGFVVSAPSGHFVDRFVITAAHCLPQLPPCHGWAHLEEKTYANFLGPLGKKPCVWTECLFANPVADIAILGTPDDQELFDQAAGYEALMESITPLGCGGPAENGRGWMLSLKGEWFSATLKYINDGPLLVSKATQPIAGGMSGSPIVSDEGAATGVVALSDGGGSTDKFGSLNPRLTRDLPGWILRACRPKRSRHTTRHLAKGLPKRA